MIEHWNSDRAHLALACERAYKYVRTQFLWSLTAKGIVQQCEEVLAEQISKSHYIGALNTSKMDHERPVSNIGTLRRATRLLKREGVSGIKRVIKSKL
jgi:hypothetical protein